MILAIETIKICKLASRIKSVFFAKLILPIFMRVCDFFFFTYISRAVRQSFLDYCSWKDFYYIFYYVITGKEIIF